MFSDSSGDIIYTDLYIFAPFSSVVMTTMTTRMVKKCHCQKALNPMNPMKT